MSRSRRKIVAVATPIVVAIVVLGIFFGLGVPPPGAHVGFPSVTKVASITEVNVTSSSLSNKTVIPNADPIQHKQIYYVNSHATGVSPMLFIEVDEFNDSSAAISEYWNITQPGENSPVIFVNYTYKDFAYSYLYNNRVETTTWYAWGIYKNYLFDMQATSFPITNNSLVSVIHAQIDAME